MFKNDDYKYFLTKTDKTMITILGFKLPECNGQAIFLAVKLCKLCFRLHL